MTTEAQAPTTTEEVSGMGHSMKRKEDPRFIRGRGQYIEDVTRPNMV
jgi:aerobic carbon-monoxide dehydrogenase large subunit